SPSSSPRCATVSCTAFRPCRTERTNRQYRCARPPFRTTVCRRYTPPHLALVAIATTRAPRKARRLALHPDSASARRIPLALPARCSRRIYFRMPSWGSWARCSQAPFLETDEDEPVSKRSRIRVSMYHLPWIVIPSVVADDRGRTRRLLAPPARERSADRPARHRWVAPSEKGRWGRKRPTVRWMARSTSRATLLTAT